MILAPFMKYISGGLLFLLLLTGIALKIEKRHTAKLTQRNTELVELRKADRAAYEAAQAKAAEQNKAHVQKVEQRQKEITDAIQSDYQRQLADLRLRSQARANQGAPRQPGSPAVPAAPGGTDEDGLQLSPNERLQAEEIELRLLHLQNWVEKQSLGDIK